MTNKELVLTKINELRFTNKHGDEFEQGYNNALDCIEYFINNSFPAEPSEDLEEAAKEYVKENCILPEGCNDGDITYYEGYTALAFKAGAYWQRKQIIDKACEWLRRCIDVGDKVKMIDGEPEAKSFIQKNLHRIEVTNQIIADFKKAMED